MDYTVSDFYHVFKEKFLLLAGECGLSRGVNSVGILDYELDPSVKDRYICDNFYEGMIVVSTFLYAKKNPYLIGDAVRHLVRKGCSALLIRNVFNLQIPETVLKYADSKGFPILVVNGSGVYFEDFVYEVRHRREQMEYTNFYADTIHTLLGDTLSPEEIVQRTKEVIPSLRPSYFVAYAVLTEPMATDDYLGLLHEYQNSALFNITNRIIKFEDNLLFIFRLIHFQRTTGKISFLPCLICSAAAGSANCAWASARRTITLQSFVRRFWRASMLQAAETPVRGVSYVTIRSAFISFCCRFAIRGTLCVSATTSLTLFATTIQRTARRSLKRCSATSKMTPT